MDGLCVELLGLYFMVFWDFIRLIWFLTFLRLCFIISSRFLNRCSSFEFLAIFGCCCLFGQIEMCLLFHSFRIICDFPLEFQTHFAWRFTNTCERFPHIVSGYVYLVTFPACLEFRDTRFPLVARLQGITQLVCGSSKLFAILRVVKFEITENAKKEKLCTHRWCQYTAKNRGFFVVNIL